MDKTRKCAVTNRKSPRSAIPSSWSIVCRMTSIREMERSSQRKQEPVVSNTLLFTNLHHTAFEAAGAELRHMIEPYGHIVRFIPITAFFRFLVVFDSPQSAARAKQDLHNITFLGGKTLRVYFGENTDRNHLMAPDAGYNAANLLQVPAIEKNFLLSPPGSPPVGWVQPVESGPSQGGHHEAMLEALQKLREDDDFALDGSDESMDQDHEDDDDNSNKRNRISRDSLDSLESSSGRNSSSRNTTTTDSARSSERYTLEGTYKRRKDVEDRGVRVGNKTKHVLTFGPPSSHRGGDDGGMEWEVSLPIVVVEDHDYDEDEDEDANSSNVSLNRGISAFSMSVNEGEVYGSDESFDSGSEYSGRRTPLPRTALPPVLFQQ